MIKLILTCEKEVPSQFQSNHWYLYVVILYFNYFNTYLVYSNVLEDYLPIYKLSKFELYSLYFNLPLSDKECHHYKGACC